MQDFAYLRHITLGQYLPRQSIVHALDSRTKLLGLLALSIAISLNASYLANGILLASVFAIALLSRIDPFYILGGLKPVIPFLIFFALMQAVFFTGPYGPTIAPRLLWHWGPFTVTNAGVRLVIISLLRLLDLWVLTSLLTNTTPISTISRGAEGLMQPLSAIGFPGHELAFVFTLALRFLPIFALELEDTIKAQVARGVEWHSGRLAFAKNARRVAALLVPLLADALRCADDLAIAMEARCYVGGKGRTHLLTLHFYRADWLALIIIFIFSGILVWFRKSFLW